MLSYSHPIFARVALLAAGALILAYMMQVSGLDAWVQHFFYEVPTKTWLVNANDPILKEIFYTMPKVILGVVGVAVLFHTLHKWHKQKQLSPWWIFISSILLVPALIALSKNVTFTHCPAQLKEFGGGYDFRALFDFKESLLMWEGRGKCFPAGHATAGFALMSLYFVFKTQVMRYVGLSVGLSFGWIASLYQMLKGAHFLSHSVATMILSWAIILCIKEIYERVSKKYA